MKPDAPRGTFKLSVVNILGQIISTEAERSIYADTRTTIHLDNMPSGVYFFRLKAEYGRVFTKRFIKE